MRVALGFILGILVTLNSFFALAAAPSLHLAMDLAQTNRLLLRAVLNPEPTGYTLLSADAVPQLPNKEVVAMGECSTGALTLQLQAETAITSRFYFLRTHAIGASHTTDIVVSNQEQRVNLGGVTIILPPGAVTNPTAATVRIAGAGSTGMTNQAPNLAPGVIYDIQLGTNTEFEPPLIIEIPFDPALLDPQLPPEAAVTAGYWLEADRRWVPVTSQVDLARRVIRVETRHLSHFADLYFYGYQVLDSTNRNFRTYYDPKTTVLFEQDGYNEAAKTVAIRANQYLEEAYAIYLGNGFKALPTPVICTFASSKTESEPEWAGASGYIYLARVVQNETIFRQSVAHELFHAVENQYYNILTGLARLWWHEACAEYAAWALVMQKSPRYSKTYFDHTFLTLPLWTSDKSHEYGTANFIGWLAAWSNGKLKFKDVFEELVARDWTRSLMSRFSSHLSKTTGYSLASHYRTFAADVLLNRSSLLEGDVSPWASAPPNVQIAPRFRPEDKTITNQLSLAAGYTAGLVYVLVQGNSNQPVRNLEARMLQTEGEPIVDYYFMGTNRDGVASNPGIPLATMTTKGQSFLIEARPGDFLCFLAVNPTESAASVTLKLSEKSTNLFKNVACDFVKPSFLSGAASLTVQARARISLTDNLVAIVKTNTDSWGTALSVEATVARFSTGEPVEIDLANNSFELLLRTDSGNKPSNGNSSWSYYPNLDTRMETTLSEPRLILRNPETGTESEMALTDKIIVPPETYIRYVSLAFNRTQNIFRRQPDNTWVLDSQASGSGVSRIEYMVFKIYK